jgi:hypothetical protein
VSRHFVIVEQVGDATFQVAGHAYDCLEAAMLALVDLTVGCDEEREYFVDGPGLTQPIGGSPHDRQSH